MYVVVDGMVVPVSDTAPANSVVVEDGTGDSFHPIVINGWNPSADSANIIHELIDGSIAVTLIGDRLRQGDLTFIFNDDTTAETARAILARPAAFSLYVPERPVVAMRFVRRGQVTSAIHDQALNVWVFTVGFQEVLP